MCKGSARDESCDAGHRLKAVPYTKAVLLLVAYACSGFAGLVYEVTWTRLLTLYIGHTTAAASVVVAAFLGGLAVGAAGGGRIATRLSPIRSLQAYVALEILVIVAAMLLPLELRAFMPLLRSTYAEGAGTLFPVARVVASLAMVFVPSLALGATFPMAIRWFAAGSHRPAWHSGLLYFVNTIGAAAGALLAGFVLIPSFGTSRTTYVAVAGSSVAALCVFLTARRDAEIPVVATAVKTPKKKHSAVSTKPKEQPHVALAAAVLAISGFASLAHEIAWTRIISLVIGPTTYAFAAALAAVISGVAIGSGAGTWVVGRTERPARWLSLVLAAAALTAAWTYSLAGNRVPMMVAEAVAANASFDRLLQQSTLLTMLLILPTSVCLGAAFPLALAMADDGRHSAAGRFGAIYAINTVGAVAGSLAAGFVLIPAFGLQPTLWVVSGCLVAAAIFVAALARLSRRDTAVASIAALVAAALVVSSPGWDRELLASGVYMYAPYVPKDLDLATQLKAGDLLYYEEGASATVSVKKLTGTTTLAVDGKTDASNRGDMLTQKLIAHLPLLLHENPRDVFILGLGSGVTAGAALAHPITRADVVEISPEVVEAASFFNTENQNALADPRTHLIIGDGRSHLLLSERKYDVIVSEPSNPWIAGVAALFTREFFESARDRLAPGGIICQWANAYNISDADLRSIVATFQSVFPRGTVWLVGADDVLLLASTDPIERRLSNLHQSMMRPKVGDDLATVGVRDAFSIFSLFIGGKPELDPYTEGARVFDDDRSTLEFSAPKELYNRRAGENGEILSRLLRDGGPAVIKDARASAGAAEWRNRAAMLAKADVHQLAYDDYVRALTLDPSDRAGLDGFARTAILTRRASDALAWITSLPGAPSAHRLVTTSKLLAAANAHDDALAAARQAVALDPAAAHEQLASLYADAGDTLRLDAAVAELRKVPGERAATEYFAAIAAFLRGDALEAIKFGRRAIAIDPSYAPTYDLVGAAYTKAGHVDTARAAFRKSLEFDAHDSTAYENLGIIELNAGNRERATKYFAEALWLVPESKVARQGLAQAAMER